MYPTSSIYAARGIRLGNQQVDSIDIDPTLTAAAARLARPPDSAHYWQLPDPDEPAPVHT